MAGQSHKSITFHWRRCKRHTAQFKPWGKMKTTKIRQTILVCIAIMSLMVTWSEAEQTKPLLELDQIESDSKGIISLDSNHAYAQGRWKRTAGNLNFSLPRINTTHISCDKNSMTCNEIIACVITPQEEPLVRKPQLLIFDLIYKVVDWSNDIISAKYEGPAADLELRISLRDKFAERRLRETKARRNKTADPNKHGQWILE
jgi:hypothetical protein